jgi:Sulfotransferase domain
MPSPSIAFCITCKGRAQHIEKTLPQNLADNALYPNCKFILLDYNSHDHLLEYLKAHHQDSIASGRLVVYSYREPTPFRVAHAKNMAHRLGILEGAEILCNLDADNFTRPGFAQFIAEQFTNAGSYKNAGPDVPGGPNVERWKAEDIFLWARMIQHTPDRLPRGINGRLAVRAHQWLNVGGYDERFAVWSPDDKDFNLRLRRMGYVPREIDRRFLDCLLHNDKLRFKHHSTHEDCEDIQDETIDSSDITLVNYGKIGLGIVFKNFGEKPTELQELPTRIFGIGMHKTATTSLHHALKILGYDSAHWQSAHWAKQIWDEMTTWGRSRTLERHYALCDLPIPLLYKQLDQAYPGSKFILTLRDEQRWLRSVQNHWNHKSNRSRASWSTDPFSHKVHKLLYGQKGFDADIFLARYRRHNAEVLEYFKDRPDDLLIMDMDNPQPAAALPTRPRAGWPELCGFLKRPIPDVEYPRAYVTRHPEDSFYAAQ